MFKLTHAILSGEMAAMLDLLRYPYSEFKVVLSDGGEVVAVRDDPKEPVRRSCWLKREGCCCSQ